jgi:hypothetical protein
MRGKRDAPAPAARIEHRQTMSFLPQTRKDDAPVLTLTQWRENGEFVTFSLFATVSWRPNGYMFG